MDQSTRNTLRNVVTQCRKLLEESVAQVLQGQFGIYAAGKKDDVQIEPEARMSHLSEEDRAYRQDLLDHYEHIKALGYKAKDALAQLIREVAFTHLNRFCAYRMMESRGLIRESVSKGLKSQGFLFYLADHEEDERRFNTGQQDVAYRHFLNWLGGTLSEEIGVLFAPTDPANRLYPPQRVIDQVLGLLNDPELAGIWSEDEAVGWVYQYFTPKELRDQARKESQAPRNSYELAFRNQFFTPRYVVEFLTDNTLGRIWYEMRQGNTRLKDQCRYMVRRPTEVFLKDGEAEPKDAGTATDDLPQDELLKLPVYVPFRAKKDPRELRILDPACGSGHFLLYCFDLLLTIYEEAYGDPDLGPALKKDYPTLEDLRRDVPRLILAHNLHGIDIDPRASQIAALALWLRCQRAYQEMGIKQHRPKITRSNIVCAEPMPGEEAMLKNFVERATPPLLGQLMQAVFSAMALAGEAGSLLQVEELLNTAVANAHQQYKSANAAATDKRGNPLLFTQDALATAKGGEQTRQRLFDLSGVTQAEFFAQAEAMVIEAMGRYAEQTPRLQHRLFADDAARGLAFVDLCRRRYDIVLMNPPFGKPSKPSLRYLRNTYEGTWKDVYAAFFERAAQLAPSGLIGAITSSQFLHTKQMLPLRKAWVSAKSLRAFVKLGHEVLDGATVDTGLSILANGGSNDADVAYGDVSACDNLNKHEALRDWSGGKGICIYRLSDFSKIATTPFAFHSNPILLRLWSGPDRLQPHVGRVATGNHTFDDERFVRLRWEVPPELIGSRWRVFEKGGEYQPYYMATPLLLDWRDDGRELRDLNTAKYGSEAQVMQSSRYWFTPGLCYSHVSSIGFGPRVLPAGAIFSSESISIFPQRSEHRLPLLGLLCSTLAQDLVNVFGEYRKIENRAVSNLPIGTNALGKQANALSDAALKGIQLVQRLEAMDETSPLFVAPDFIVTADTTLSERDRICGELQGIADSIDSVTQSVLHLPPETLTPKSSPRSTLVRQFVYRDVPDRTVGSQTVVSFCVGVAYGRWQPCVAGQDVADSLDFSPFDALPSTPPASGSVRVGEGKARREILVDDVGHSDDIADRCGDLLEVMWGGSTGTTQQDLLKLLNCKTLRDYFRKPGKGGFWSDHISRYSESHRNAPIYWLLQSSKKNYAIWLYYHRLDKDILFKALVNYVEPKIRLETDRLESLRAQKGGDGTGKATKKLDKEIEKQEEFLSELRGFEEKLRRAAELHLVPDLNDGVVLNIAPLHELVPWKEAEKYWEELLEGKYEWSSIGKQLREKGLVK